MTNLKLQTTITELIQAYNSWDDAKMSSGAINGLVELLEDAGLIEIEKMNDLCEVEMLSVKASRYDNEPPMLLMFD